MNSKGLKLNSAFPLSLLLSPWYGLNCVPPKPKVHILIPRTLEFITVFGDKVFKKVTKLL